MKTVFNVVNILFPVVNVASVKSTIDGKVYRDAKPQNSTKRDIVVSSLPISYNPRDPLIQQGTAIINCYAKNLSDGKQDIANLKSMTDAVIAVIAAYSHASKYYVFEITSQLLLNDVDQPEMSYSSLRVDYTIEGV